MSSFKERDLSIDILRCIGLLAIFVDHTFSSSFILQSVQFDVVLLMLLSGTSFAITTNHARSIQWSKYLKRRFVRLVLPTWLFLAIFFSICYMLHKNVPIWHPIYAFLLCTEWYVWIIRVFLFIALLSPFILSYTKVVKNNHVFMLSAFAFFVVFDLLTIGCWTDFPNFGYINSHFLQYMLYIFLIGVPYVAIYAIGHRLQQMTKGQILFWSFVMFFIFFVMCYSLYSEDGVFVISKLHKYPPHIYYISFALGVSLLMWNLRYIISNCLSRINILYKIFIFIGQNTIWIYLWHVLILTMTKNGLSESMRFLLVLLGGIIIYLLQYTIVKKIVIPRISKEETRKTVSRILLG